MNRNDFVKLTGANSDKSEYMPVACLLRSGGGCVGHYNSLLNEDLVDTCVLVNARIIEFKDSQAGRSVGTIHDFGDFLEEVVGRFLQAEEEGAVLPDSDAFGKSIPLTAIAFEEISVVFPVSHISALLERAKADQAPEQSGEESSTIPTFLDFEQSEVLKLLRTKLW